MRERTSHTGTPTLGGRGTGEAAASSAFFQRKTGRERIALHTELFPPLLSFEGAFSIVFVDSSAHEICSGGNSLDPRLSYETNLINMSF